MPVQSEKGRARGNGRRVPVLKVYADQGSHPNVKLDRPVCLIGRMGGVHLPLEAQQVSKLHALIVRDASRVYLRDLASTNGVQHNGQPVQEAELTDADTLRIGAFTLQCASGFSGDDEADAVVDDESVDAPALVHEGRRYAFPAGQKTFLIGRRDHCDLRLDDDTVAPVHAVIFRMDGRRYVRDLNTPGGTYLNGVAVHQAALTPGDELRIGDVVVTFNSEDGEPALGGATPGAESLDALSLGDSAIPLALDESRIPLMADSVAGAEAEERPAQRPARPATPTASAPEKSAPAPVPAVEPPPAPPAAPVAEPALESAPLAVDEFVDSSAQSAIPLSLDDEPEAEAEVAEALDESEALNAPVQTEPVAPAPVVVSDEEDGAEDDSPVVAAKPSVDAVPLTDLSDKKEGLGDEDADGDDVHAVVTESADVRAAQEEEPIDINGFVYDGELSLEQSPASGESSLVGEIIVPSAAPRPSVADESKKTNDAANAAAAAASAAQVKSQPQPQPPTAGSSKSANAGEAGPSPSGLLPIEHQDGVLPRAASAEDRVYDLGPAPVPVPVPAATDDEGDETDAAQITALVEEIADKAQTLKEVWTGDAYAPETTAAAAPTAGSEPAVPDAAKKPRRRASRKRRPPHGKRAKGDRAPGAPDA